MTDTTTLNLTAGLDRALAWHEGGSVRYLVADLTAEGETAQRGVPALNLALAVDISGVPAVSTTNSRSAEKHPSRGLAGRKSMCVSALTNRACLVTAQSRYTGPRTT